MPGRPLAPEVGDFDGDGDLDLLAGESSGEVNLWRNEGSTLRADFVLLTDNLGGIDVGRRSAPAFGDWDGDGVDTVCLHEESTSTFYFRNENTTGPAELALQLARRLQPGMRGSRTSRSSRSAGRAGHAAEPISPSATTA